MNKAFEKIINRIDKEIPVYTGKAKQIVREVAEEYKDIPNIIDGLKIFLQEKFNYCAEQAEMNLEAECNSEIDSYFRDRKELYLDRANIYGKVMREIDRIAGEYNNGWIPCSERLPEERDSMFAKLKGTDKWSEAMFEKISDDVNVTVEFEDGTRKTMTLHTNDGKWNTNNRIVKFNVIAWQPLPEPFKESEKNE